MGMLLSCGVADEFVGPLDEVLHVGQVGVSAVMLSPGEFAVEKALFHGRHFGDAIILVYSEAVARAT